MRSCTHPLVDRVEIKHQALTDPDERDLAPIDHCIDSAPLALHCFHGVGIPLQFLNDSDVLAHLDDLDVAGLARTWA